MTDIVYFETTRFGTEEKIKIPLDKVLEIKDRSTIAGEKVDHARVFIIGEGDLILISLEDAEKLNKLLIEFRG